MNKMCFKNINKKLKSGDLRNFVCISLIIIFALCPLWYRFYLHAQEDMLDNSGAAFLTIDPFCRSASMGSAFTGVSGGITSLYFNPGGLALSEGDIISTTHCEWFQGMRFDNLAVSHSMNSKGALGIDVKGFYTSGLEKRTADTPESEGEFGAYFINFGVTYSKNLFYFLPLGFSLRGIYERIDDNSAFGASFDVGLIYRTAIDDLQFGISLKNIGPEMKFKEEKFKLPSMFRIGAGYRMLGGNLLLSVDIEKQGSREAVLNIGSEVVILGTLFLRAGLNGENREDLGKTAGLSLGAGFAVSNLKMDYAFVNYDYLGMTHRFGLTFTPGVTAEERKRIEQLALEEARKSLQEKEHMMSSMYLEKGEELISEKKYEEALSNLDISLVWNPSNEKAKELVIKMQEEIRKREEKDAFTVGKKAFEVGNFLEAIAQFDRVIELNPKNTDAVDLRSQVKNRLEEESLRLAQEMKEKSEDIQSLFNSAVEEYSKANYKIAISKWEKVLAFDPTREDARSYINKANEKVRKKITSLEERLENRLEKKDWLGVLTTAREIKLIDSSNQKAREGEKKANSKIKALVKSNLNKAKEYYNKGNLFSSEEHFRIVLRYDPRNKEAKSYLNKIEKGGQKEDADKWYLKGIDAYTKNKYKLAISYWNRCLSIEPDYEKAKKNIERAQKKLIELGEIQ